MSEDQAEFGLVMPFVTVASRGGPHDDDAYTAGWEMGALDAELEHRRPAVLEQVIHAVNAEQADLIGMKHGYRAEISAHDQEWSYLLLTRLGNDAEEETCSTAT